MSSANGQTITVCGNVFRLVEMIGRGSYGTVHKAINLSSGAAVAVKMIGKEKLRRPHERQSIEKEIETMRVAVEQFENGHPHIVRLLCTKESQQHIFIVQEYCAGGDIAQLMKTTDGLTETQARLYMSQLASGLQFLRSQNVVHRDLKPANLLLSSPDFGFARELESEMMAESVVGSPLYMAPELLEYKCYDAKADLWSVGIILYEMLANEHPFLVVDKVHATNHLALRRNIYRYYECFGHVRFPKKIKVSLECEQLVAALLQVDPRKRISFEDYFRAPFLLPPAPSDTDLPFDTAGLDSSETKQPLVAEKQTEYEDWATFSDEYVMVESEYEDVGRKVLNSQDLNVDLDAKPKHHTKEYIPERDSGSTLCDGGIEIRDIVIDTSSPRHGGPEAETARSPVLNTLEVKAGMIERNANATMPKDHWLIGERRQWVTDDNRLEELLGICYKSFTCGSVALFVPTPFGDYIAFHEGCPHYYLSEESIVASKKHDRNPPYVLGHIVYIEDHETSDEKNPYCLREGTKYHVASVTPLATSSHNANGSVETADSSDASHELPLSQVLTGKAVVTGYEDAGLHQAENELGSTEHQRISFRSFQISSLALFFLKGGKLPYVAFNDGAPNYFLANESIQAATLGVGSDRTPPAYICGEIIFIDTFQATEDFNPYRLSYGTRFYVVTVVYPTRT
ncbi:hypothetical protein CCR75_004298 [Bremia lactucae]|uniref:Protein kinase domain-containing protein n=1 Tax=Bremia lactucae TaxID=4779 RepID=A0A976IIX0_BRELC|nr:hypothetical protein CCR75_004298 [Bremia lactucae]